MAQDNNKAYLDASWETLYETYYQEIASESLAALWERTDVIVLFLVALTTSGSAVAGWALWSISGWKVLWIILAGIASIASIAHTSMRVPSRVKEQEELRNKFAKLRFDLETFWQELKIGLNEEQAKTRYKELREKASECIAQAHPDILYTMRFRRGIQERLNETLKQKGYLI